MMIISVQFRQLVSLDANVPIFYVMYIRAKKRTREYRQPWRERLWPMQNELDVVIEANSDFSKQTIRVQVEENKNTEQKTYFGRWLEQRCFFRLVIRFSFDDFAAVDAFDFLVLAAVAAAVCTNLK